MDDLLRQEKGAVLIIVEIFAVVLIVFAGLAIDSTLVATSKAQQRHIVEYVAIKAISEYISSGGATYDLRLEDARRGAQEIARVNVYIGKNFLVNPTALDDVSVVSTAPGVNNPTSPNGRITPGLWHINPPVGGCTAASPNGCPCNQSGAWVGSCFEPLDMEDPANAELSPSAFKAELWTKDTSPLRALLMSIQGETTIKLSSTATAAMFQRHGYFLLDLSRSVAGETHVPFEATDGGTTTRRRSVALSADPAYRFTNKAPGGTTSCAAVDCKIFNNCLMEGGLFAGQADHFWNSVIANSRGMTVLPSTRHYRSDYSCFATTFTEDGTASTSHYMIDTWRGNARDPVTTADVYYDGPEPLSTLLHGINYGLNLMRNQNVPGDRIGFIGFDRSAGVAERVIPAAGTPLLDLQDSAVSDLIAATDLSTPNNDLRYRRFLLFPRVGAGSNLEEPLRIALDSLAAEQDARNSDNFVILLSNGLPSCAAGRACGKDETAYRNAMASAENVLQDGYLPRGFKFHFVQVGATVQPHTLLAKSTENEDRCMQEKEFRMSQPRLWYVDYYNNNSPFSDSVTERADNFFRHPARLYNYVQESGGVYAALRPPCPGGNVQSTLDSACAAQPKPTPATQTVTDELGRTFEKPITLAKSDLPDSLKPFMDDDGRLSCDPLGRTRRKQLEDAIGEMIGQSPFQLVE